eukprot:4446323-Pleurochrysis_carterae.AAC.1
MTAEPGYGDAVWAAVYSKGKYTGTLAAEGMIPSAVVAARQQLVVLLRAGRGRGRARQATRSAG